MSEPNVCAHDHAEHHATAHDHTHHGQALHDQALHDDPLHDHPVTAPPPPYRPDPPGDQRVGSREAKIMAGLSAVGLAGACLYTAALDPSEGGVYPLCPLRALTGVDCALCGGLRATHALLNFDVPRAAGHNLLVVVAAPLIAYAMVQWFLTPWGVKLPSIPKPKWSIPALVVLLVVFSVVRNLPWGPFPYLYSGD